MSKSAKRRIVGGSSMTATREPCGCLRVLRVLFQAATHVNGSDISPVSDRNAPADTRKSRDWSRRGQDHLSVRSPFRVTSIILKIDAPREAALVRNPDLSECPEKTAGSRPRASERASKAEQKQSPVPPVGKASGGHRRRGYDPVGGGGGLLGGGRSRPRAGCRAPWRRKGIERAYRFATG